MKNSVPSLFNYEFLGSDLKKVCLETLFGKHCPKL